MNPQPPEPSIFPVTQWSQVARAAQTDVKSLDELLRQYWKPLRIYLLGAFPKLGADADLWLQDFAQDRVLREGWLSKSDPQKGRFRNFLKSSLRNFVLDRLRSAKARGEHIEWDESFSPEGSGGTEEIFDQAWAEEVVAEALRRMEQDCRNPEEDQPRRAQIWEMFEVRLLKPMQERTEPPQYQVLVERFKLRSPSEASNLLLSGKRIFRTHVTATIKEYASKDEAVAFEISDLARFCAVT